MKVKPADTPRDMSMPAPRKLFVSTAVYALGRQLGMEAALAEMQVQLDKPGTESLPCVRTIHRLRQLVDVELFVDCGATCIGKARSRAFHEAYERGLEAWISVDDDVEVTLETCRALVECVDEACPRIIVVPFMTRGPTGGARLNITMPLVRSEREFRGAKLLNLVSRGHGFGMVGMNRLAMAAVVAAWAEDDEIDFVDDDGQLKLALFHDMLGGKRWLGEDFSFFARVPRDVSIEALLVGTSSHGGLPLDLGRL